MKEFYIGKSEVERTLAVTESNPSLNADYPSTGDHLGLP